MAHERRYFAAAAENARGCGWLGERIGFVAHALFGPAMLVCGAGVVWRETVVRVGGFDRGIRLMGDTDFLCRVMRAACDRLTLHYRIASPSLMHDPNPSPEQRAAKWEGFRRFRATYRRRYGTVEFLVLAAMRRAVPRLV